ncbi:hypothetical protein PENTCL1PPCAC_22144, partial [Pristionchus entomophagus]
LSIHSFFSHPRIIQMYSHFEINHKIYIVMEYAKKGDHPDLASAIPRTGFNGEDEQTAAKYIFQIADALHYCHSKNLVHRDVKTSNILVDAYGDLKLCDFGYSVRFPQSKRRTTFCGTLDFLAPEMVRNKGRKYVMDGKHVDLWALGVVAYKIVTGTLPFVSTARDEEENEEEIKNKITTGMYNVPPRVPGGARRLIGQLLKVEPENRLSLERVMTHPWIVQYNQ